MAYTRHLMIIPVALREAARTFALALDPAGGGEMFRADLYAATDEAQETPTHCWANALCSAGTTAAVAQALEAGQFPGAQVWTYDARQDADLPRRTLESLGLVTKRPDNLI